MTMPHRCRRAIGLLAATMLCALGAAIPGAAAMPASGQPAALTAFTGGAERQVHRPDPHVRGASAAVGLPAKPDSVRRDQWQLTELQATTAWQHSTGRGITVGVLDSGVDAKHPDLVGQVLPGLDLVSPSKDGRYDPVGHGTTVAGLIAGSDRDDKGALGLAPDARILPVRVLDSDNRYEDATIVAEGVRWAVDHGAKVLNLSLGGIGSSLVLAEALDYAFAKDVVVIACNGNVTPSAPTEVWYPAREPGVVAVSGLDPAHGGRLWANSITGPATVISAPATALVGARPGGYWRVQGTSFAAPLVTATAALIRSRWPDMSAGNVVNRLVSTADDLGPVGRDESYGFGALNPVAALTKRIPAVAGNPLDSSPPPGHAGFGPASETGDEENDGDSAGDDGGTTDRTGGGAGPLASGGAERSHAGLIGGAIVFIVLLAGGIVVVRRLDRPPF